MSDRTPGIRETGKLFRKRPFLRRGAFPLKTPPKPPDVRFNTRLETRVRELDRRDEFRDSAGMGTSHKGGMLVGYARVCPQLSAHHAHEAISEAVTMSGSRWVSNGAR